MQDTTFETRRRFFQKLAQAHAQAKHERRPLCPVKPGAFVELHGHLYATEWQSDGPLSKTMSCTLIVTDCETGVRVLVPVMRKERTSRKLGTTTVRYNLTGVEGWDSRAAAEQGLVAHVAPQLASLAGVPVALTFSNPVTGPVQVPVRMGGLA